MRNELKKKGVCNKGASRVQDINNKMINERKRLRTFQYHQRGGVARLED